MNFNIFLYPYIYFVVVFVFMVSYCCVLIAGYNKQVYDKKLYLLSISTLTWNILRLFVFVPPLNKYFPWSWLSFDLVNIILVIVLGVGGTKLQTPEHKHIRDFSIFMTIFGCTWFVLWLWYTRLAITRSKQTLVRVVNTDYRMYDISVENSTIYFDKGKKIYLSMPLETNIDIVYVQTELTKERPLEHLYKDIYLILLSGAPLTAGSRVMISDPLQHKHAADNGNRAAIESWRMLKNNLAQRESWLYTNLFEKKYFKYFYALANQKADQYIFKDAFEYLYEENPEFKCVVIPIIYNTQDKWTMLNDPSCSSNSMVDLWNCAIERILTECLNKSTTTH